MIAPEVPAADPEAMTLDELGLHHGTDKASGNHGYLPIYETFFAPMRGREIVLLEIGVKAGASLRVWRDYFPKGRIVGVDIRSPVRAIEGGRISIEVADQGNREALAGIAKRHGPFDIIVEDGSHRWPHQIMAIAELIPALKPGGYFISEDLQVSFPPLAERYSAGSERSAFQILQELAERVLRFRDASQPSPLPPELQRLVPMLSWVLFQRHACVLRRRG